MLPDTVPTGEKLTIFRDFKKLFEHKLAIFADHFFAIEKSFIIETFVLQRFAIAARCEFARILIVVKIISGLVNFQVTVREYCKIGSNNHRNSRAMFM